ncbi:histidinol-phosphate transaminase [Candidatus Fermentibacteria bacterium]|nr:histidinol-phosphate transaminase [Candidatus Fermentibacteria bacterium]
MASPADLIRPHVSSIPLYVPGKPMEEVERELGIVAAKLASNENPLGPAPEVIDAIIREAPRINLYPELEAPVLRTAIARKLGVAEDSVLVTAGASHFLEIAALAYIGPGFEGVSPWPSFVHYAIASRMAGGEFKPLQAADPRKATIEEILNGISPHTRLLFIANPNNPTGAHYSRAELEELLSGLPERVMVVWDEAYFEYVTASDYPDGVAYLSREPQLLVTRSFSKVYALAGLRIGYGVGHPSIIAQLARIRGPFKISIPAQAAALAAFAAVDHTRRSVNLVVEGRRYLAEALAGLGLSVWPSQGNFVTVDVKTDASAVAERLERVGYIVRPLKPFGLANSLRVTVGTMAQNEGFVRALAEMRSVR